MKTITLEQAYAKATIPPITVNKCSHGMIMQGGIQVASCGHHQTTEVRHANAALLAHAFNVLPEVVKALNECLTDKNAMGYRNSEYAFRRLDAINELVKSALAKANQVQLPD